MTTQRRNRRAGIEDRWTKTTRNPDGTTTKTHSANHGQGKRWRARWVDDTGTERSKSFDRKTDAQTCIDELTTALTTGNYVQPKAGRTTIAEIHTQWTNSQAHIKDTTAATRQTTWTTHVQPRWATTPVADVHTSAIRAWVATMSNSGAGPATIENALGVLRMTLDTAVDDKRLARNPCTGVKAPRREHKTRGYLTHTQVETLAQHTGTDATVIRFLAYTGLRWGEMAALRVESFDMLRRRIVIRQAVAEVKGKLIWSTAKNHERRSVPFPRFLTEELAERMQGKGRDDLVFPAVAGGVLRVSLWRRRVFAKAVEAVQAEVAVQREGERGTVGHAVTPEFPRITPHDLRHTAASLSISAGANVKAVQTMLGHKSAALTLDTYADLFPDDLEAVAEALDLAAMAARRATADSLRTGGH
ncbi:site-specific integrase [Rhodococcus sp. ARC_M12]|uniref:tyrosine-type recombinase/integrase n=1 Tax=Rhodococcus sp. ARC_M12 TaxID=2928854 RepID=UPI001FB260D9|nr:site-specific integrase [Rhodococcus sp. ARC_M12]MCJ0980408.1 site-specific integrase [Rhodococcus sp. ARC_M12]